jgi:hypothetical protein
MALLTSVAAVALAADFIYLVIVLLTHGAVLAVRVEVAVAIALTQLLERQMVALEAVLVVVVAEFFHQHQPH